jgi:hypothetical protein
MTDRGLLGYNATHYSLAGGRQSFGKTLSLHDTAKPFNIVM